TCPTSNGRAPGPRTNACGWRRRSTCRRRSRTSAPDETPRSRRSSRCRTGSDRGGLPSVGARRIGDVEMIRGDRLVTPVAVERLFYIMVLTIRRLAAIISLLALGQHAQQSPGRIAYASKVEGNWEILVTDSDGRAHSRLTTSPSDERFPVFSPDGKRLIFG